MLPVLLLAFCYGAETLNGTSISLPDKPWPPEKPPETEGLPQERSLGRRAYYNADWLGTHGSKLHRKFFDGFFKYMPITFTCSCFELIVLKQYI